MTSMAEQEFLSHWFGRDGRWYALPPEFNFRLHNVFLSSQWWPPGGQERPSKFYQMLHDTPIIKDWHFSGEKEPVDCLFELVDGESAEESQRRIDMLAEDSMLQEWRRMHPSFKKNEEHLQLILSVHKQATEEWLRFGAAPGRPYSQKRSQIFISTPSPSRTTTCKRSSAMRVAASGSTGKTSTIKPETMCSRTAQKP